MRKLATASAFAAILASAGCTRRRQVTARAGDRRRRERGPAGLVRSRLAGGAPWTPGVARRPHGIVDVLRRPLASRNRGPRVSGHPLRQRARDAPPRHPRPPPRLRGVHRRPRVGAPGPSPRGGQHGTGRLRRARRSAAPARDPPRGCGIGSSRRRSLRRRRAPGRPRDRPRFRATCARRRRRGGAASGDRPDPDRHRAVPDRERRAHRCEPAGLHGRSRRPARLRRRRRLHRRGGRSRLARTSSITRRARERSRRTSPGRGARPLGSATGRSPSRASTTREARTAFPSDCASSTHATGASGTVDAGVGSFAVGDGALVAGNQIFGFDGTLRYRVELATGQRLSVQGPYGYVCGSAKGQPPPRAPARDGRNASPRHDGERTHLPDPPVRPELELGPGARHRVGRARKIGRWNARSRRFCSSISWIRRASWVRSIRRSFASG